MKIITIEGTEKTPSVKFNAKQGSLEIKGRSLMENPREFYKPIMEGLEWASRSQVPSMQVDIELEYFNSSSSKYLFNVLKLLDAIHAKGCRVDINWYYEDEDMNKAAEYYQTMLAMKINIKPVSQA